MKSLSNTKLSLLISAVLCLVMLVAIPVGGTAATVVVTSLADSGPGSLRQVITAAGSGDTVIFDPILTSKTIILTNGEINISKNLTINGLGVASLSISATNLSRVFSISGGSTVAINSLTVTGGNSTDGAGIYNNAGCNLAVANCAFSGNTASTSGGAIYNNAGCNLAISNCSFSVNAATTSGGAIYNDGTLALTGCSVLNNAVTAGQGAGLYNGTGTATISGGTMSNNVASAGNGGAVYNDMSGTVTVTNLAVLTSNSALEGGGICNTGVLIVVNSTLTGNTASGGAGLANGGTATVSNATFTANNATALGGGLYNHTGGTINLIASQIISNTAVMDAGGFFNFGTNTTTSTTFADNVGGMDGGGLTSLGSATVSNCTFTGNVATWGAALNCAGDATITRCLISNNTVTNDGGGLYLFGSGQVSITECIIVSNSAAGNGGALYSVGTNTIEQTTFAANVAGANGGALYATGASQTHILISTFAGNSAAGNGGAILNNGELVITEATIAGNSATSGGALEVDGGQITIDNTILAASTSGGNFNDGSGGTALLDSKGHNLSDDDTALAWLNQAGDLNSTASGLDPAGLLDNGGTTPTIALLPGSAAISAGGMLFPPFTDQRGEPRFVCGKMDIGAYQTQDNPPPIIALIGDAFVTNECSNLPFIDPGAVATNICGDALTVSAGRYHSLGLRNDGIVEAWGSNAKGQTGIPGGLSDVIQISAGEEFSLALKQGGAISGWGDNAFGQISIPVITNALSIAAGGFHGLARLDDGTVTGWGNNDFGQTTIPPFGTTVTAVSAGRYHSLALLADGTVVAWGAGTVVASPEDGINYGQSIVPAFGTNVTAVAAGGYHSLALLADGTVVAWGAGTTNASAFVDFGQSLVPAEATNVVAIAAGGYHSLALRADGTVVAWGNNDHGQSDVPSGLPPVAAIAAGFYHSMVVTRDGTIIGWGLNSNLQTVATSDMRADLTSEITKVVSGVTNDVGTFTITYSVVDPHGASNSVVRTVTIADSEPPVFTVCPTNEITGFCNPLVTYVTPVATDNCVVVTSQISGLPSGSTFPLGVTTNTFMAVDHGGNATYCTFTVTVEPDVLPPVFTVCPDSIVTSNDTGFCAARVWYPTPVATDACAVVVQQISGLASGALFPVGVTTNVYSAVDTSSNTTLCTFYVTVNDTEKPKLTVPANIKVATLTNSCSSGPVTYTPTATDNCGVSSIVADPPSGSSFPLGTNTVTVIATDTAGNTATNTFTVTVKDETAPTLTCPSDIVTNGFASGGAVVTFSTPTVTDNCSITPSVLSVPASGSVFPFGTTIVRSAAADAAGNVGGCTFTVTVLGPLDNLQKVFEELMGLGLTNAATTLNQALNPDLWSDAGHINRLDPKFAKTAFKACRKTLSILRKKPAIDNPGVPAVINDLLFAMHQLAVIQLDDAVTYGGNAKNITNGYNQLTSGETAIRPESAAKCYERAWIEAVKSLRKLFI